MSHRTAVSTAARAGSARRSFALTTEHRLGALGVALAVASSFFAYKMVARGERDPAWAPFSPYIATVVTPWKKGFAPAFTETRGADPIVTGSIRPSTQGRPAEKAGFDPNAIPGTGLPESYLAVPPGEYVVRAVVHGVALVQSSKGYLSVRPGELLPGAGRVQAIEMRGDHWFVVTSKGVIDDTPG
jgi:hypothetical protein